MGPGAEIQGDVGTLSNTGTPRSLDRAQLPLWVQNPERHLSRPRADPPTRRPGWAAGRVQGPPPAPPRWERQVRASNLGHLLQRSHLQSHSAQTPRSLLCVGHGRVDRWHFEAFPSARVPALGVISGWVLGVRVNVRWGPRGVVPLF